MIKRFFKRFVFDYDELQGPAYLTIVTNTGFFKFKASDVTIYHYDDMDSHIVIEGDVEVL